MRYLWNHNSASIIELNIIVSYIIQYLKKYFVNILFLESNNTFPSHIVASGHVTNPVQGISKINPGCGFHTLECIEQCFVRQIVTDKLKHLNIRTLCRCQTLRKKLSADLCGPLPTGYSYLLWLMRILDFKRIPNSFSPDSVNQRSQKRKK